MPRYSPIDNPTIIVEPFVPPPRQAPSGPRPLPAVLSPPSRQSSFSESLFRQQELQPKRSRESVRPPGLDPTRLGYENGKYALSATSEDSLPLLTPATPKRSPAATQLPTVPISTAQDVPWTVAGSGFMAHFEPVPIKPVVLHTILCVASFPVVYLLCSAASGLSLFWARAIVGAVCGVVGLAIGYNLINLSRRGIEATVWATVIHESMRPDGGVTLDQLNDFAANPASPWPAMRLLFRRTFQHKGTRRTHRRSYDRKPWTLCIIIFLFVAVISACIVFVFGRIVDIYTNQERQYNKYSETTVIGDLSAADIQRAANLSETAYSNFNITWSLIPFSASSLLPIGRAFDVDRLVFNPQANLDVIDTIYVAETYSDQLAPGGLGFGTFDDHNTANFSNTNSPGSQSRGQILRWPKWGIRMACQLQDNLDKYLTPLSAGGNITYLYVPKTTLYSVFAGMDIIPPVIPPVNFTELMEHGDQPTANISEADIAVAAKWWPNGVAHSFFSMPLTMGEDGTGWLQVEVVLVRLNRAYAPNGTFSVYARADPNYLSSPVGYDVAVCIEEFKPYMVDAYNTTSGSPTTMGLVHPGIDFDKSNRRLKSTSISTSTLDDPSQRGINSTGKFAAFGSAHENSRNVIIKDNGRDFNYVPNPTLVSFTNGSGPLGYTRLDPARVAAGIAKSDSQHLLPYLAGSQPIIARSYPDKTVAYIKISKLWLAVSLTIMMLLGYLVAIFVPRLPLGLPRRDFGVYSWLAAIEGDAIVGIPSGVGRYEQLEELQRRGHQVKVRYAAPNEQDWALSETERAHKEFFERYYTMR